MRTRTVRTFTPAVILVLAGAVLAPLAADSDEAAAPVTVAAVQDAYVDEAEPRTTHDTAVLTAGRARTGDTVTYLAFDIPDPPRGADDVSATLQLTRERDPWPSSVEVSRVADDGWSESTLTWSNAPETNGKLARVQPRGQQRTLVIELPFGSVTRAGRYTFAITATAADVAVFHAREDGVNGPRMVLRYDGGGPPPPPPPPGELSDVWIGAAASEPAPGGGIDYSVAVMNESNRESGPLRVRRSFDTSLPVSFQQSMARDDAANGYRSFVSWKPPNNDFVGAAEGRYDAEVRAWAQSVPTTGVYATAFHEPENDMNGPQFVAMQRHLYDVVKAANPSIRWGPVYMAYWWDDGTSHYIGDPDAWWPGNAYADFTAVDVYSNHGLALEVHPEFRGWYDYMVGTGEEMIISEYGQYVVPPGQVADPEKLEYRAELIAQDAEWLAEQGTISMWLYWDAMGEKGDWRLNDPGSQAAWQAVAEAGRG